MSDVLQYLCKYDMDSDSISYNFLSPSLFLDRIMCYNNQCMDMTSLGILMVMGLNTPKDDIKKYLITLHDKALIAQNKHRVVIKVS